MNEPALGERTFWDMKGSEGFFIRVQDTREYETRSHDYEGNLIEGAVCAIEIKNPDISFEECKRVFKDEGLEDYIESNNYMILFEGYKYEEIEDGAIAKMDAIRKIWDLRNGNVIFDMKVAGSYL